MYNAIVYVKMVLKANLKWGHMGPQKWDHKNSNLRYTSAPKKIFIQNPREMRHGKWDNILVIIIRPCFSWLSQTVNADQQALIYER